MRCKRFDADRKPCDFLGVSYTAVSQDPLPFVGYRQPSQVFTYQSTAQGSATIDYQDTTGAVFLKNRADDRVVFECLDGHSSTIKAREQAKIAKHRHSYLDVGVKICEISGL